MSSRLQGTMVENWGPWQRPTSRRFHQFSAAVEFSQLRNVASDGLEFAAANMDGSGVDRKFQDAVQLLLQVGRLCRSTPVERFSSKLLSPDGCVRTSCNFSAELPCEDAGGAAKLRGLLSLAKLHALSRIHFSSRHHLVRGSATGSYPEDNKHCHAQT